MTESVGVGTPGGFAPQVAIAFGADGTIATGVDRDNPLPAQLVQQAALAIPVAGVMTGSGSSAAFTPDLARAIWARLSGNWAGTVVLERSTDGGATWFGLTAGDGSPKASWTGNLNAPVAEETVAGASYRLTAALASGTLAYEVRQ